MLRIHDFSLEEYTIKTKYPLIFCNIFLKDNYKLQTILTKLSIPPTTYHKSIRMEQNIGFEIKEKILNHFGINDIEFNNIKKYEIFFSVLITKIYFKTSLNLQDDEKHLDKLLEENSIMKPIFLLFKLLINISYAAVSYERIKSNLREDFLYVKKFEKFFTMEYKILYYILEIFLDKNSNKKIDIYNKEIERFPKLKGLMLYIMSTRFYINSDYLNAYIYAKEAEEIFEKDCNYNRLVLLRKNICAYLNCMERYEKSRQLSEKSLLFVASFYKDTVIFEHFKIQYYESLLMLNEYYMLQSFVVELDNVTLTDHFYICIMFLKLKDKEKLEKQFSSLKNENPIDHVGYIKLLEYLIGNSGNKINNICDNFNLSNFNVTLIKIIESI